MFFIHFVILNLKRWDFFTLPLLNSFNKTIILQYVSVLYYYLFLFDNTYHFY